MAKNKKLKKYEKRVAKKLQADRISYINTIFGVAERGFHGLQSLEGIDPFIKEDRLTTKVSDAYWETMRLAVNILREALELEPHD